MSLPESSVGKPIGYFLDWWFMWEGQLHVSGGGPGAIKRQADKTGGDKPVSSVSLHQPVSALGSCLTSLDDRLQPISEINPSPSYLWLWCFIALMETLTQTQSLHFFFFYNGRPSFFLVTFRHCHSIQKPVSPTLSWPLPSQCLSLCVMFLRRLACLLWSSAARPLFPPMGWTQWGTHFACPWEDTAGFGIFYSHPFLLLYVWEYFWFFVSRQPSHVIGIWSQIILR